MRQQAILPHSQRNRTVDDQRRLQRAVKPKTRRTFGLYNDPGILQSPQVPEVLNEAIRVARDLSGETRTIHTLVIHLERIEGCRVVRIEAGNS